MAKTSTFAITHFGVAFGVTYALTGDLILGGTLALIEPAVNTVAYFFHEKIWDKVTLSDAVGQGAGTLPTSLT